MTAADTADSADLDDPSLTSTDLSQVVVGGRNKYAINGVNVQNNRVQDLFRSVKLNVNNPHFLIMQGRITKVLNMKPPEVSAGRGRVGPGMRRGPHHVSSLETCAALCEVLGRDSAIVRRSPTCHLIIVSRDVLVWVCIGHIVGLHSFVYLTYIVI